jgi:rhodanese-related sulfurtransferase
MSPEMQVEEVSDLLADETVRLLDVRTPGEWEAARIPAAELVTEALAEEILASWDRDTPIVVHCHHGVRSNIAAWRLRQAGFTRVANMTGGIEAWSSRVDPSVPRYR